MRLRLHVQRGTGTSLTLFLGIFIIGAPVFFGTVWGWIKRWFDPVTVSKIFILGPADVLPVLTSFIDLKNIPKAYGGGLEWDFYDEPRWDDAEYERIITFQNGHTKFPLGPMYLRPKEDGKTIELLAVGSVDKKQRMEVFATIPKAFPAKTETPSTTTGSTAVETAPTEAAPVDPETQKAFVTPAESKAELEAVPADGISKLTVN